MVYGGAVLADTVCHLNNWGRCSLPIHTLEVGLKQRQLDTVNYFLKSKECCKSNLSEINHFGLFTIFWETCHFVLYNPQCHNSQV